MRSISTRRATTCSPSALSAAIRTAWAAAIASAISARRAMTCSPSALSAAMCESEAAGFIPRISLTAGWTSGGAQTAGRVHCLTSRAHRPGGVGTMAVLLATSVKANIIKQKKVARRSVR